MYFISFAVIDDGRVAAKLSRHLFVCIFLNVFLLFIRFGLSDHYSLTYLFIRSRNLSYVGGRFGLFRG